MQRIDEKREASGQNAMLEQVRTWQQEQDTEPDKYAVFDTMSADWGGEEDGFVFYEIPEEYSRTGGYFPEKMQVYTYCVCKQYGVRYEENHHCGSSRCHSTRSRVHIYTLQGGRGDAPAPLWMETAGR